MAAKSSNKQRVIGRWSIGETISRAKGYSWTKYGQDIKTGKSVSLKFIQKSDILYDDAQMKLIDTHLEGLCNIRHPNVKTVYSYNLNAAYPLRETQRYIDTILLIEEYNSGERELFDLAHYHMCFKESVAKTLFRQVICGLEACHNANIIHGDLTLENLLLDNNFNVKIIDTGLSNIIKAKVSNAQVTCFKAPEILLNSKCDLKCDVFSVGVILFILLAGYPPFNVAVKNDKWFKQLVKGNIEKFWRAHQKSPIGKMAEVKDLLTRMLTFDPKNRIDINGIKTHQWVNNWGDTLKTNELIEKLYDRYRNAEIQRRIDMRRIGDFAETTIKHKSESKSKCIETKLSTLNIELFPQNDIEGIYCDLYTYTDGGEYWKPGDIYNLIEQAVVSRGKGISYFDWEKEQLVCVMNVAKPVQDDKDKVSGIKDLNLKSDTVTFTIKVFESRLWKDKYLDMDETDEIYDKHEHKVFIVRADRIEGDSVVYCKVRNGIVALYCSTILKGLPKWAREVEKNEYHKTHDESDHTNNILMYSRDEYDEYDDIINQVDWKKQSEPIADYEDITAYPLTEYKTYLFWQSMEEQLESDGMDCNNVEIIMGFLQKNSYDFDTVTKDMNCSNGSKSRLMQIFNDGFNRKALEMFNIFYKTIVFLAQQKKYDKIIYNNASKWWIEPYKIDLLIAGFIRSYIKKMLIPNAIIYECSNFHGYMLWQ